jgi:hypothetical protein
MCIGQETVTTYAIFNDAVIIEIVQGQIIAWLVNDGLERVYKNEVVA